MTHQSKITRGYVIEMTATMFLYTVILFGSLRIAEHLPKGAMQTAIVLTPVLPILLTIFVIIRYLRRVDEYCRLQAYENIAISAAVTAAWTLTYGFLEGLGYPRLSMFMVWTVMGAVWLIIAIARAIASR